MCWIAILGLICTFVRELVSVFVCVYMSGAVQFYCFSDYILLKNQMYQNYHLLFSGYLSVKKKKKLKSWNSLNQSFKNLKKD